MKRKHIFLALLALVSVSLTADVAVLYSSWANNAKSFFKEFDKSLDTLKIKAVKYENIKLDELTKDLPNYEMVIVTSCANYDNTTDLKPYADAWRDYLANGGMIFLADANYVSVLGKLLNRLGPEFELIPNLCISHTNPSPDNAKAFIKPHNLLHFPTIVTPALQQQSHWGHLTPKQPEKWDIIETCVDGKALTLAKTYGKGLLFVTVHSSLRAGTAADFARNTITNMRAQGKLKGLGLDIISMETPTRKTDTQMMLKLKTTGKTDGLSFSLKYTGKNGMTEAPVNKTVDGDTVTFTAPITYQVRGKIQFNAMLKDGQQILSDSNWQDELPEILTSKLRRKHFYPGMNELEAWLTAVPDYPEAGPLSIRWTLDSGIPATQPIDGTKATIKFAVGKLALGKHIIAWELLQNGKAIAKLEQDFFIHPEATMRFREDGTLLNNGKPFFPFGMYHVSWAVPPAHRLEMIRNIAQYGYNLVHVGILKTEKDTETYGQFLDECQKLGIYVITEFGYKNTEVIEKYKNHPAVLGWNPGDEPANRGISNTEMFNRYDTFKQLDPNHIAYTVICIPAQYKNYASGTDVLSPDPYPIPNAPIDNVYRAFKSAWAEAMKYDTALWGVPQCFGGYGGWKRPPNGDEYRGMLYLALMAGVKGFVNYTYFDNGFFLPKDDELWDACKKVPTEMKPLIPFILNGKRKVHEENANGIYIATWTLDGRTAIVVVNASKDKALPFELKGDFANAKLDFGTVQDMKATAEGLSGALRPLGQAVFYR